MEISFEQFPNDLFHFLEWDTEARLIDRLYPGFKGFGTFDLMEDIYFQIF